MALQVPTIRMPINSTTYGIVAVTIVFGIVEVYLPSPRLKLALCGLIIFTILHPIRYLYLFFEAFQLLFSLIVMIRRKIITIITFIQQRFDPQPAPDADWRVWMMYFARQSSLLLAALFGWELHRFRRQFLYALIAVLGIVSLCVVLSTPYLFVSTIADPGFAILKSGGDKIMNFGGGATNLMKRLAKGVARMASYLFRKLGFSLDDWVYGPCKAAYTWLGEFVPEWVKDLGGGKPGNGGNPSTSLGGYWNGILDFLGWRPATGGGDGGTKSDTTTPGSESSFLDTINKFLGLGEKSSGKGPETTPPSPTTMISTPQIKTSTGNSDFTEEDVKTIISSISDPRGSSPSADAPSDITELTVDGPSQREIEGGLFSPSTELTSTNRETITTTKSSLRKLGVETTLTTLSSASTSTAIVTPSTVRPPGAGSIKAEQIGNFVAFIGLIYQYSFGLLFGVAWSIIAYIVNGIASVMDGIGYAIVWIFQQTLGSFFSYNSRLVARFTSINLGYCSTCWIPAAFGVFLCVWFLAMCTPLILEFVERYKGRKWNPLMHGISAQFSFWTWSPVLLGAFMSWAFIVHSDLEILVDAFSERPDCILAISLILFKFVKSIVSAFSCYYLTYPYMPPPNAFIEPADATVIISASGDFDEAFEESLDSILANNPAEIIISTKSLIDHQNAEYYTQHPTVRLVSFHNANKRQQFIQAATSVRTPITVHVNESVIWPRTFFRSALAPFNDPIVGHVGVPKQQIRNKGNSLTESFSNYLTCISHEAATYENTTANNIDGGIVEISSHSALFRTTILHDVFFRQEFLNESWLWASPLIEDDDSFTTRWIMKLGYTSIFQNHPHATVTSSQVPHTPSEQAILKARTSFRSHFSSLFIDRVCWWRFPWSTYAIYISAITDFSLFYETYLIYAVWEAGWSPAICSIVFLLFLSKIPEIWPFLRSHPWDVVFVPAGILWGYYASVLKVWGVLTARSSI